MNLKQLMRNPEILRRKSKKINTKRKTDSTKDQRLFTVLFALYAKICKYVTELGVTENMSSDAVGCHIMAKEL